MLTLIRGALLACEIFAVVVVLHQAFLALASVVAWRRERSPGESTNWRFLILIPAHDEERGLGGMLSSLRRLDYPVERRRVAVVADNCSDGTARVAAAHGAEVLVRTDPLRAGKGYALNFGLSEMLREEAWEAVAILDADSRPDARFLRAAASCLDAGHRAVQGYYDVEPSHPADPLVLLYRISYGISRNFRHRARAALGWSTPLLGNGMVLRRDVARAIRWEGGHLVEDVEMWARLLLAGIPVHFAPQAIVRGEVPATLSDAAPQRRRWDRGKFRVRNRYVPALLRRFLATGWPGYLDGALDLLTPPFSITLTAVALLGFLHATALPPGGRAWAAGWAASLLVLGSVALGGWISTGARKGDLRLLWWAPLFCLWRTGSLLLGSLRVARQTAWARTRRRAERTSSARAPGH